MFLKKEIKVTEALIRGANIDVLSYYRKDMVLSKLDEIHNKIKLEINDGEGRDNRLVHKISIKFLILDDEISKKIEELLSILYRDEKNPIAKQMLKEIEDLLSEPLTEKKIEEKS